MPVPAQQMRWQSWLVLAAVIPWCAIATLRYALTTWNRATQTALGMSLALALLVLLARAATPLAAPAGGVITAALTLGLFPWYHSSLPALLTLFVLTWTATRFGRGTKQQLGVAEDKRGRDAGQVAANLGVAGMGAAVALVHPSFRTWSAVVVTAALAEATADTLASELGEVLGGPPVLVNTFRRVEPGTDGAVSLIGTVAGMGGAILVVLMATYTLGLGLGAACAGGLGALGGFFFDSLLGATAERRGWLNNDAVNMLSTLAAAVIATMILVIRGWT